MKEEKLTESQIDELLGEVEKVNWKKNKEINEVQKKIKSLEAELEWAESQSADDYKYITNLENRLDALYEHFNKLDES